MKTFIIILISILFTSPSFSQVFSHSKKDIKLKQVPDDAVSSLYAKYGSDVIAKWERKGRDYYAAFEIDRVNYEAKFSSGGGWLETSKQVTEADLPDAVIEAINSGNYQDWAKADMVFIQKATGENMYRIAVIKEDQKKSLLITPEGKIIESDRI